MKLERIILTGLYCKEDEKDEEINQRAISIPLDSTYHQIWAPNGYGKTLALKILSKLRFPAPQSGDVPWERAFIGELRHFFRQPMTTDPDLIRGRDGESLIPYFDDIYSSTQEWVWSEQLQVLPFHTLYAIFIDIENDIRYILEWDIKIFMEPEKSIGYSITEIKNAKNIPFLLEKEIDGESYSVPTIDIVNEVNKLSKVYPDEVNRYDSELFIERPSTAPESQIFDRIEDCRAILSNFTLGYYETLDIISDSLNWFTFSHDILIQINKLQLNEELPEDFRNLIREFVEQWKNEINDRINEENDPWSRQLMFDPRIEDGKIIRRPSVGAAFESGDYVFYAGLDQVEPETLSNGQRSVVTIETLLLLARVRAHLGSSGPVSYAMVIDEPETGLAEYWVDRLIERFRDIQYEFKANQIEGFSLIILTHRKRIRDESPIHDGESKYSLMQPYHPENLFDLYDFEEE